MIKCSNSDAVLFPACRRLISLPSLAAHHRMDMTDFPVRNSAQKAVELVFVTNISPTTFHEMLKETNSSRGNMNIGVCPRSEARRVAAMEDVLDLCEGPYDQKSPTVCAGRRNQLCCMLMSTFLFLLRQVSLSAWITSMNAKAHVTCL